MQLINDKLLKTFLIKVKKSGCVGVGDCDLPNQLNRNGFILSFIPLLIDRIMMLYD